MAAGRTTLTLKVNNGHREVTKAIDTPPLPRTFGPFRVADLVEDKGRRYTKTTPIAARAVDYIKLSIAEGEAFK